MKKIRIIRLHEDLGDDDYHLWSDAWLSPPTYGDSLGRSNNHGIGPGDTEEPLTPAERRLIDRIRDKETTDG